MRRALLHLLVAAVLGAPRSGASAPDLYSEVERQWLPFFQAFLEHHKRKPRPGVHIEDIFEILTAVAEGLALRELVDPTDAEARGRRMSMQGTAALALVYACSVPAAAVTPETLDEAVDRVLQSRN